MYSSGMEAQTLQDLQRRAVALDTKINQLRYSPEIVPDLVHRSMADIEADSKALVAALNSLSPTAGTASDGAVRPGETVMQRDARLRAGNRAPFLVPRPNAEDFRAGHPGAPPAPATKLADNPEFPAPTPPAR